MAVGAEGQALGAVELPLDANVPMKAPVVPSYRSTRSLAKLDT